MKIETKPLIDMAPTLERLGQGLSKSEDKELKELGTDLQETSIQFSTLPEGHLSFADFNPEALRCFYDNLIALAQVFHAASETKKRTSPLLLAVGDMSDRLNMRNECEGFRIELGKALLKFPHS